MVGRSADEVRVTYVRHEGSGSHERRLAAARQWADGAAGRSGCTQVGPHAPSLTWTLLPWELKACRQAPGQARGSLNCWEAVRPVGGPAGAVDSTVCRSRTQESSWDDGRGDGGMGWHPQSGGVSARSAAKPICAPVRCHCCSTTARYLSPTRSGLLGPSRRSTGAMATALVAHLGFHPALAAPSRSSRFAGACRHQPAALRCPVCWPPNSPLLAHC